MKDVIAIGSTVRDAFFETDFELIKWPKTPSGKALAIPFAEKFGAKSVHFTLGGNAANASVTFARQGLLTGVFAKIGSDVAAEEIMRIWRREGVSTRLVARSKLPTSYSVVLLQKGDRSIITYHGAADEFSVHDVPVRKLKSRWWYVSLPGDSYKEFDKLIAFAKRNRVKVALNPSFKHYTGAGKQQLLKHLKDISFLVVNEGEAAEITGIPFKKEREVFRKLDDMVPGIVAVTSGPKGVAVSDGTHMYKAGVFGNKKILDRTGAGDAFGSGFVAGLIHQTRNPKPETRNLPPEAIEYAIRLATANATSVVECIGATEGILSRGGFHSRRFQKLPITRKEIT